MSSCPAGAIPVPRPTGPSPVTFQVDPLAGPPLRWRWTLQNVTDHPVELATDRRLVWLEVLTVPASTTLRRRLTWSARCVHDARPPSLERAVRTVLAPGQRYSELIDLRDTCALRIPPSLTAGAAVVVHYGFAPLPARGVSLARWRARTVVFDTLPYPVNDLTASVTVPVLPSAAPSSTSPPTNDPSPVSLQVEARDAQAPEGERVVVTATLRNTGQRPLWTYYRTPMFRFELETPSGRQVRCDLLGREANVFRDFFLRLGPGARRSTRLVVADYCPAGTLDEAGLYPARLVFESRVDEAPWLTEGAFVGQVRSAPFLLRVSRGRGRYRPFGLVISD